MADMDDDDAIFFNRVEDAVFPVAPTVKKLADLEIHQAEAAAPFAPAIQTKASSMFASASPETTIR